MLADGEPLKVDGEADAEIEENVAVTLRIAAGNGYTGSGAAEIPDLTGIDEAEAYKLLKEAGLFMEKEGVEHSSLVSRGQVIRQEPEAGAGAASGDLVKVVISAGARKVQMADVRNMEENEARVILEELGLTVSAERRVDSAVEAGRVISQDVEPGMVDEGTEVKLVISQGSPSTMNPSGTPGADRNMPQTTTVPRTQPTTKTPETTRPPETTTQAPTTTAAPRTTAVPKETTTAANDFWRWRESMQSGGGGGNQRQSTSAAPEETFSEPETQPAASETQSEEPETQPAAPETAPQEPETQPAAEPESSEVDFWRWRETAG